MPELPEVETVKNTLKNKVINKIIEDVDVYYSKIIEYPSLEEFKKHIKRQRINDIKRRGKWLMFELDNYYLLSHLRMEGKYYIKDYNEPVEKHEHIIFKLNDNGSLRYADTRKFGRMHLIEKDNVYAVEPLKSLGLEPWDSNLNVDYLKTKFNNKRLPIKTVLLDQSIMVGIGNIYDDEILFLSNISPLKSACNLNDKELDKIIFNTKKILEEAIKKGGTTIRSYESDLGVHGRFQQELLVHTKDVCPICGNKLIKEFINGRSTYYCNNCQK